MDQARLVNGVLDPDAKGLADLGREAEGAVRLADAVDRRSPAVHFDVAPLKPENRWRRLAAVRRGLRSSEHWRRGQGRNGARDDCASGQHRRRSPGLNFALENSAH